MVYVNLALVILQWRREWTAKAHEHDTCTCTLRKRKEGMEREIKRKKTKKKMWNGVLKHLLKNGLYIDICKNRYIILYKWME